MRIKTPPASRMRWYARLETAVRQSSRLIASVDHWQLSAAAARLRAPGVHATFTLAPGIPKSVVDEDLATAGWTVISSKKAAKGKYRYAAHGRLIRGDGGEILEHARKQLLLTLAGSEIDGLHLTTESTDIPVLHQWMVEVHSDATDEDRQIIRKVVGTRQISGSEAFADAEITQLLGDAGVTEGVWRVAPANASAVAAHPGVRMVAPSVLIYMVTALAVVISAAAGAFIPSGWLGLFLTGSERVRPTAAMVLAVWGVCLVYVFYRAWRVTKRGARRRGLDAAAAVGLVAIPVLVSASVCSALVGWRVTVVATGVGLLGVLLFTVLGRPAVLVVRLTPSRAATALLVSIPVIVIVLNIPSATFLIAAGSPEVLGSVPIGTVVATGWLTSVFAFIGYWSVLRIRGTFRSTAGPSLPLMFAVVGVVVSLIVVVALVGNAVSRGLQVREGAHYDSAEYPSYGLLRFACQTRPGTRRVRSGLRAALVEQAIFCRGSTSKRLRLRLYRWTHPSVSFTSRQRTAVVRAHPHGEANARL